MRPNGEEILRGVQGALMTFVLPELQTDYARTELMAIQTLLGIAASDWDGAAQRLVDDNATLRDLARSAADALASVAPDDAFAGELRALADETDASLRLSDLRAANDRLRDAIGRLGARLEGVGVPALRELRAAIIAYLRADLESRALPLMGPRADG